LQEKQVKIFQAYFSFEWNQKNKQAGIWQARENILVFGIKKNSQLFIGDGWLNREMGGKVREIGSAHACFGNSLGSKFKHLSKIQNGRHKQRSGQHTLAR
jgi:hypothetical protein